MKKYIYPMLMTTAMIAAGCNSENLSSDINDTDDSGKEKISFSMSDGSEAGGLETRAGFTAGTKIVMRIQTDASSKTTKYTRTVANAEVQQTSAGGFVYSKVTFSKENGYTRYWDDAYGRDAKLSVYAVAIANQNDDTNLPISILKDGKGENSTSNVKDWDTSNDNTLLFSVEKTEQTTTTIANQDLVYSNNIQSDGTLGKKGRYVYDFTSSKYIPDLASAISTTNDFADGQMQFELNGSGLTSNGKFDQGHLDFKHALSRITVKIVEGEGFDKTSSNKDNDFKWKTGTNLVLASNTISTSGTLNVKTGEWTSTGKEGVAKFAALGTTLTSGTFSGTCVDANGYYRAQVLPDYEFADGSTTNILSFNIDNNVYYVDDDMIYEALKANSSTNGLDASATKYKMEQGKNYFLTITVNKTAISSVTATIADWIDVVANDQSLYNSYVTLSLKTTTGAACSNFDLYRLNDPSNDALSSLTTTTADNFMTYNWKGDYTDKATLTDKGSGVWSTNWYWDSNKDFYHFRTVNKGTTINTTADKDNFTITSGAVSTTTDYHWGAPMKSDADLKYEATEEDYTRDSKTCTKEGFSQSIYKAIGSTTGTVAITEIHMMSEIYVTVKTKDDGSKVKLYDSATNTGTTVTITRFSKTGTVDMGTGFVRPSTESSNIVDETITAPATFYKTGETETNMFSWSVVPQKLARGTGDNDYIGITIKTPDNNQYYIVKKLSEITASSVTTHGSNTEITDPNQSKGTAITQWFPGHHYYYTFTITKKGIEAITCTVANWIDVTAANKDLNLED